MKLSLRARAALYYFSNSSMSISAVKLAEEVAEGRNAILTALKELRDAGLIETRKERMGSRIVTTSHVTEKGFLEANSWGLEIRPLIQHSVQNSTIQVLANSDININKTTIDERLGGEMGYEFFGGTSDNNSEAEEARLKAVQERKQEYREQKEKLHAEKLATRASRQPKDWNVNQSVLEFQDRVNGTWGISPWKVAGSRFYIALASARRQYDTDGAIELEMMNIFFTQLKVNKETDGDKLWKFFISRFSELATQAKARMVTPEQIATAVVQAEDSWKGL